MAIVFIQASSVAARQQEPREHEAHEAGEVEGGRYHRDEPFAADDPDRQFDGPLVLVIAVFRLESLDGPTAHPDAETRKGLGDDEKQREDINQPEAERKGCGFHRRWMRLIGQRGGAKGMQRRTARIAAASGTNLGETLFGNMVGPPRVDAIPAGPHPSPREFDGSSTILSGIPPPVHEGRAVDR